MNPGAVLDEILKLAPDPLRKILMADDKFRRSLLDAYATPPRAYHNIEHVLSVTRHFDSLRAEFERPGDVYCAILFHDAVYVAGRSDNEARSARLARNTLAPLVAKSGFDLDRVAHLIELTARHGQCDPGELGFDEACFLDCDMAIVGADEAEYAAYAHAIRLEHPVSDDLYRRGRSAFLRALLARPHLYFTKTFLQERERPARRNLREELQKLEGEVSSS